MSNTSTATVTPTIRKIARIIDPGAFGRDMLDKDDTTFKTRRFRAISKATEIMNLINTGDFLCEN